jgi:membrane protein YqaA with SNARE-associated domain
MNVIPAFMPATWTVLSFIAVRYPVDLILLAIVGAVSATAGRWVLAKLSRAIIRQRFLSEKTRENIDHIKVHLEQHQGATFGIFLFYAFSPFPSNQLFLAYGLTNMPLWLVTLPFFIGRICSYFALTFSVSHLVERFYPESFGGMIGGYFVAGQIFSIGIVWLFTKIDWKKLIDEHRIGFMR